VLVRAEPTDGELDVAALCPLGLRSAGRWSGRRDDALVDHSVADRGQSEVPADDRGGHQVRADDGQPEPAVSQAYCNARRAREREPGGGEGHRRAEVVADDTAGHPDAGDDDDGDDGDRDQRCDESAAMSGGGR